MVNWKKFQKKGMPANLVQVVKKSSQIFPIYFE